MKLTAQQAVILRVISEQDIITYDGIEQYTGYPRPSIRRIFYELVRMGFLVRNEERYCLVTGKKN